MTTDMALRWKRVEVRGRRGNGSSEPNPCSPSFLSAQHPNPHPLGRQRTSTMALPPIPRSAVATLVALVVLLLLLARSSSSPAAPPAPNLPPTHKDGHDSQRPAYSKQIIALGDLHGSLSSAKRVLRMAGVIDVDGKWVLGNGTLVQSGDIVE